ncbi:MAG: MotA/TolQ/ExbB proton channel family protein [Candidatus Theseobacter exili]|nr:MotA/TolQ/ExbB proton channel family protein [Candidatus Theseobacter exili]
MESSLIASFKQSGFMGQVILIFLVGLSAYAWAVIIQKYFQLRSVQSESNLFLEKFERARGSLLTLLRDPTIRTAKKLAPLHRLYIDGCRYLGDLLCPGEGIRGLSSNVGDKATISILDAESIEKGLQRGIADEVLKMERSMIILASTAGVGPLLGLLGTVWGIMNSFRGMAAQGSASIASVAPGISEALVTTVAGLIVAIPALIAHNIFRSRINVISVMMENYVGEFVSQVERQFVRK